MQSKVDNMGTSARQTDVVLQLILGSPSRGRLPAAVRELLEHASTVPRTCFGSPPGGQSASDDWKELLTLPAEPGDSAMCDAADWQGCPSHSHIRQVRKWNTDLDAHS